MKKIIMLLVALIGFNANAGVIKIEVDSPEVTAGESVSVSLIASGFTDIYGFDFDLNFNSDIFTFDAGSLTSDLPLFDGFLYGLLVEEVDAVGFDKHIGVNFLDALPVSSDFVLATFDLIALSPGLSEFSMTESWFFDLNFSPVLVDTSNTNQAIIASSKPIPEPATWLLALMPALLLLAKRRTLK